MFSVKFQSAALLAVLFFVVSSPMTYRLVDRLVGGLVSAVAPQLGSVFKVAEAGCPTQYGLVVHSVVYGLVCFYLVKGL
jgi:hypothetical protein